MVLDEQHVLSYVNKKTFPFIFFILLFTAAFLTIIIMYAIHKSAQQSWIIGGTEMLIYLMSNAICCLIVNNLSNYLKKTIPLYLLNVGLLLLCIYLLYGSVGFHNSEFLPIYSALVMCFFIAIVLVVIIRKVLSVLKD